jgi:hypothetical protein
LQSPEISGVINLDEVSLSNLIRWNTGVVGLQENVFFAVPEPSALALFLLVGLFCFRRGGGPRRIEKAIL